MTGLTDEQLSSYLHVSRKCENVADLAFVLGSPRPDPAHIAAKLFRDQKVKGIFLTGGAITSSGLAEADFHRSILLAAGVPEDKIFSENTSLHTLENILFARPVLEKELPQGGSLIAICRWFHSRRVLMTLKKNLATWRCFTETYDSPRTERRDFCPVQREKAAREWAKIPLYLAKGDLEEI